MRVRDGGARSLRQLARAQRFLDHRLDFFPVDRHGNLVDLQQEPRHVSRAQAGANRRFELVPQAAGEAAAAAHDDEEKHGLVGVNAGATATDA